MRYARSLAIAKRLDDLLELIKQGRYSSPIIAQRLCISEQTVYRDVVCLKSQGHDILAVRKADGGWAYRLASSERPKGKARRSR